MKRFVSNFKNNIAKILKLRDLNGFNYTVTELVGMYDNINISTQWHGKVIDDDILQYKTSNTIFILGSGPSINDISSSDWDHISVHDSVGFNYWFAHDFVPKFYVFQSSNDNMLEILNDKFLQYENIPFIIRGSSFAKGNIDFKDKRLDLLKNNPVYYINEYPISSRCSIDIDLLVRYMEALGFMTFGKIANFIPKWRCTLGLLIMLAYQMGYKNIILCGMDMHNSEHFWDFEPYIDVKDKYSLPGRRNSNIKLFTDESLSPNTVPKYIYYLQNWMKNKNDVEIFVMSNKTLLYPAVNVYRY